MIVCGITQPLPAANPGAEQQAQWVVSAALHISAIEAYELLCDFDMSLLVIAAPNTRLVRVQKQHRRIGGAVLCIVIIVLLLLLLLLLTMSGGGKPSADYRGARQPSWTKTMAEAAAARVPM